MAYNPKGVQFTSDGRQLEAAFGNRLFNPQTQHFRRALERLMTDPASRRAMVALYGIDGLALAATACALCLLLP